MTIEEIKDVACECFGVNKSMLESKSRKIGVVCAKIAISNTLHKKGYTLMEIGDVLDLNHTTIIHHINTFGDRYKYDATFRRGYDKFNEKV